MSVSAKKQRPARPSVVAKRPRPGKTAGGGPVSTVTPETVAARLLALSPLGGATPTLWRKADLGRALSRAEKRHLDAALARLQEARRLVALEHGESVFFAFAEPLREWLGGGKVAPAPVAAPDDDRLREVYRRLVRESGGFPDVKISLLARAFKSPVGAAGGGLAARLLALWRTGDVMLSLGDWSLASAETRAAAVEMDGEKYLLVRFEEA